MKFEAPDDLPPGSRIGPYVVLEELGSGGMGQVFLGNDTRLKRRVALKRLFASMKADEDVRAAVIREARAAARVTHSNVATVYDVLEQDGNAFIVMEYLEGESLARHLARERLPFDRVIAIGQQLADALTAAHAKGVIHADLKPGNIHFVSEHSVKILDFGIAQAVSTATSTKIPAASSPRVDQPNIVGTPAYMSPEQMLGQPLDERSDVYSLGVVLFEMATGHRLFSSTNLLDLVTERARRPPRADREDPKVPKGLADLIARAVEFDLATRYQTAAEIHGALSALEQPPEWSRWPWTIVGSIGVLAVLTALGFVTTRAFEMGVGREGVFRESPWSWPIWGARSLIAPTIYSAVVLVGLAVGATLWNLVVAIPPVNRLMTPLITRVRGWISQIARAPTGRLSEILLLFEVAVFVVYVRVFWPLISSFFTFQMQANGWIGELRPSNVDVHDAASYSLTLGILVFGIAWYALIRLRTGRGDRDRAAIVIAGVTALAISVFFLSIRYRVLRHNQSERVLYSSETCYMVSTHGEDALLFCPLRFPRSLTVKTAGVTRTGETENIFTPFDRK